MKQTEYFRDYLLELVERVVRIKRKIGGFYRDIDYILISPDESAIAIDLAKKKLSHDLENNIKPFEDYFPLPYTRRKHRDGFWILKVSLHQCCDDTDVEKYSREGWAEAIEITRLSDLSFRGYEATWR